MGKTRRAKRAKCSREVSQVLVQAEALGCRVTGGGQRHFQVLLPDGKSIVTIAASPSSRSSMRNAVGRLRRMGVPIP